MCTQQSCLLSSLAFLQHSEEPLWVPPEAGSGTQRIPPGSPLKEELEPKESLHRNVNKVSSGMRDTSHKTEIHVSRPTGTLVLDPGHQVVEEEEDQHQSHGHVAEDLAVVPAGAHHRRESLHTSCQQTSGTQEIGILVAVHER